MSWSSSFLPLHGKLNCLQASNYFLNLPSHFLDSSVTICFPLSVFVVSNFCLYFSFLFWFFLVLIFHLLRCFIHDELHNSLGIPATCLCMLDEGYGVQSQRGIPEVLAALQVRYCLYDGVCLLKSLCGVCQWRQFKPSKTYLMRHLSDIQAMTMWRKVGVHCGTLCLIACWNFLEKSRNTTFSLTSAKQALSKIQTS